jgi:hypothetical protein
MMVRTRHKDAAGPRETTIISRGEPVEAGSNRGYQDGGSREMRGLGESGMMTGLRIGRNLISAMTLTCLLASAPGGWAQEVEQGEQSATLQADDAAEPIAKASEETTVAAARDLESLRPGRPPLLREGSRLVEANGVMTRDALTGDWIFRMSDDDPETPDRELTMLPSTVLGEMVAVVEFSAPMRVVFEATGDIFVYKDRNYFLPTHPPRLVRHENPIPPAPSVETPPEADDTPTTSDQTGSESMSSPPADAGGGDTTDDIMRDLDEAVGTIIPPSVRDPLLEDPNRPGIELADDDGRRPAKQALMREGSTILARRGRVRRGEGGTWLFVFDADAEGKSDPPMTIMPCLLLERIERFVTRRGDDAPILLSGQVTVFGNRNYLLPTIYRIPREQTQLSP